MPEELIYETPDIGDDWTAEQWADHQDRMQEVAEEVSAIVREHARTE